MRLVKSMKKTKRNREGRKHATALRDYSRVLHNDDRHSFDYVIEALMHICDHQYEQAVQCTLITHHIGCCSIRNGKLEPLRLMKEALIRRELSATIDYQQ